MVHSFEQFALGLVKRRVTLYAAIVFGSSGAATLKTFTPSRGASAGSYSDASTTSAPFSPPGTQGIASVTKLATGNYKLTLQSNYQRLLGVRATFLNSASLGINAPFMSVQTDNTDVTTSTGGTVEIIFKKFTATNDNTLVAANPASGEFVVIELELDASDV